ncbi:MAG: dipeptidase [Anaerolineae bacterium]
MPDSPNSPMLIVDAHLDIAYNAVVLRRDLTLEVEEVRSRERKKPPADPKAGTSMVTWPALREGHVAVVGGSIFVEPEAKSQVQVTPTYRSPEEAHDQAVQQLDYYRRTADELDYVRLLETEDDLDEVLASWQTEAPVVGLFVVMEGADPIQDPGELDWWVERGLRGVGLAWAAGTRYAGGNGQPGPLTDDGEALTRAMADYNLMLDISHLWEDAAATVLDRYPGPIVATHANPRVFVDSPRMLSDDVIRRIAEREGVIGIVAFNRMLDRAWRPSDPRTPLSRMVEAVDHVCQITGTAQCVGIGSDLDGGFGRDAAPAGLASVADLGKIGELLREKGYAEAYIESILHSNWLRVMRTVLSAM